MISDSQPRMRTDAIFGGAADSSQFFLPRARERASRYGAIKLTELIQDHRRGELVPMPWPELCGVQARLAPSPGIVVREGAVRLWKSERLLRRLFAHFELGTTEIGLEVRVSNPVAPGKGAATSTVNMRLVAEAVAELYGLPLDTRWLVRELATIEATDAIIPDGRTCVWDFRRARQASPLYTLPPGVYLGVVPRAATLDTEALERKGRPRYTRAERASLSTAFTSIGAVLRRRDLERLAQLATRSAEINHRYIPNPSVEVLEALRARGVILGYAVAHSGTAALALAAPGTFVDSREALREAFEGRDVELRGFEYRLEHDTLPFLIGAGRELWRP